MSGARHVSVGVVQRSSGGSACRRAAYVAAERLTDPRTGETFDYTDKGQEVGHSEIMAPEAAPAWVYDRAMLWSEAEKAENRKNSQTARTVDVALPRGLTDDQQVEFAREMAKPWVAMGMVADFSIHRITGSDGLAQDHVHYTLTMRRLAADGQGFSKKKTDSREWNAYFGGQFGRSQTGEVALPHSDALRDFRAATSERMNAWLEAKELSVRVEFRSNAEAGADHFPPPPRVPQYELRMAQRVIDKAEEEGRQPRREEFPNRYAAMLDWQDARREYLSLKGLADETSIEADNVISLADRKKAEAEAEALPPMPEPKAKEPNTLWQDKLHDTEGKLTNAGIIHAADSRRGKLAEALEKMNANTRTDRRGVRMGASNAALAVAYDWNEEGQADFDIDVGHLEVEAAADHAAERGSHLRLVEPAEEEEAQAAGHRDRRVDEGRDPRPAAEAGAAEAGAAEGRADPEAVRAAAVVGVPGDRARREADCRDDDRGQDGHDAHHRNAERPQRRRESASPDSGPPSGDRGQAERHRAYTAGTLARVRAAETLFVQAGGGAKLQQVKASLGGVGAGRGLTAAQPKEAASPAKGGGRPSVGAGASGNHGGGGSFGGGGSGKSMEQALHEGTGWIEAPELSGDGAAAPIGPGLDPEEWLEFMEALEERFRDAARRFRDAERVRVRAGQPSDYRPASAPPPPPIRPSLPPGGETGAGKPAHAAADVPAKPKAKAKVDWPRIAKAAHEYAKVINRGTIKSGRAEGDALEALGPEGRAVRKRLEELHGRFKLADLMKKQDGRPTVPDNILRRLGDIERQIVAEAAESRKHQLELAKEYANNPQAARQFRPK